MRIVIISGYFNPLGQHHLKYIQVAKKLGDGVWVIVNNDKQVKLKGSCPFQAEYERHSIVRALRDVDLVVTSRDTDESVAESLMELSQFAARVYGDGVELIFANGGDQQHANAKELKVCEERGIQMVFGVGGTKTDSSSDMIRRAAEWYASRNGM